MNEKWLIENTGLYKAGLFCSVLTTIGYSYVVMVQQLLLPDKGVDYTQSYDQMATHVAHTKKWHNISVTKWYRLLKSYNMIVVLIIML